MGERKTKRKKKNKKQKEKYKEKENGSKYVDEDKNLFK